MTAVDLSDETLAALALVQTVVDGDEYNRRKILDTTDNAELVVGLAALASRLLLTVARNTGSTMEEVLEVHRSLLLFEAAGGVL